MSKFKFVCLDEDLPFGPSKTRHEFETNDIHEIVKHFRDFLHMAGFNRINLSVDRDISFDDLDAEDLDEYTERLFSKPHDTKYGQLQPYNDFVRDGSDDK